MNRFIRSTLAQNEVIVPSSVVTYDLPVNALSHIILCLKFLNDTGTITDYSVMQALLAQVAKLEVLYKGQAIISGSLQDLVMMAWFLNGLQPYGGNFVKTDDAARWVAVIIPLGRKLFSPDECFPASDHGALQLQITYAAAPTGVDTPLALIETVELPDAKPGQFLKYTTLALTPTAAGWFDLDLPIGNKILGVGMFGTTVPAAGSFNASIGQVKVLLDNMEYGYSFSNWEAFHGEQFIRRGHLWLNEHIHRLDSSPAAEQDSGIQEEVDTLLQNYSFLDFDPLGDTSYAIDTSGHRRLNLRINQIPVPDASRYLPVELVASGQAT